MELFKDLHDTDPRDISDDILSRKFLGLNVEGLPDRYFDVFRDDGIRLRENIPDPVLDSIPIFRLTELLMTMIHKAGKMRLTQMGTFRPQELNILYGTHLARNPDLNLKDLNVELLWPIAAGVRYSAQYAGLMESHGKYLRLTDYGTDVLINSDRMELFRIIFTSFTQDMSWGFDDIYEEDDTFQSYISVVMSTLSDYAAEWRPVKFYYDDFLITHPNLVEVLKLVGGDEAALQLPDCFKHRVFEKYLSWSGLVEKKTDREPDGRHQALYRKSGIFDEVLEFYW